MSTSQLPNIEKPAKWMLEHVKAFAEHMHTEFLQKLDGRRQLYECELITDKILQAKENPIMDIHEKILEWYLPNILTAERQAVMWLATAKLRPMHKPKDLGNWHAQLDLYWSPEDCMGMPPSTVEMSLGWFEQAHYTTEFGLKCSMSFNDRHDDLRCHQWLQDFTDLSAILSGILRIIHPEQYFAGIECMEKLGDITDISELVHRWPSVFNGVSVIAQRLTPPHRDRNSHAEWYDLLATISPYWNGTFELLGIGVSFQYNSGTMIALCSQVLTHSVPNIDGNPFHRVEQWMGSYFAPTWLRQVGIVLHLGHGGEPCPWYDLQTARASDWPEVVHPEDEEWETIDDSKFSVLDDGREAPPSHDNNGNPMMTIVDHSDMHQLCTRRCRCVNSDPVDIQLFDLGLYPASFKDPRTAFTFQVLDDFLVDNLECKTTALNFYSKLRRVTTSAFPDSIPFTKWHGFGHRADGVAGDSELALFCPACPQPGVNIPKNWREDEDKWKYMRSFMIDGNFSAEHMKMRNPWDDVVLTDGVGYMVTEGNYKDHLTEVIESKDAIVDFQKGERQMNMDYSLSGALKTIGDLPQVLILYDVMCQYSVHLLRRFADSPHLTMPAGLEIVKGISVWHIHGHQEQCFCWFYPRFIQGAAQVDGEILETLWAPLNQISRSTRTMATSHRQETLDAHMADSNWKKWIRMVPAICKRYIKAKDALEASQEAFQALDATIDRRNASAEALAELIESWHRLENRITAFQRKAEKYVGFADPRAEWEDIPPDVIPNPEPNEDEPIPVEVVEEYAEDIPNAVPTEKMAIALPSILRIVKCRELDLEELAKQELKLQKGQANDALHHMQIIISHKSFLFCSSVRQANSQKKKTRAWNEVIVLEGNVCEHSKIYMACQRAMLHLGANVDVLGVYKELTKEHLNASMVIMEPSLPRTRKKGLSWIWNMDITRDAEGNG
ncbi:hypothetical protein EW146_g9795 [Bondarzewia mesenterica]|uniref:Uncharacterized protein n=1 Tax=Bondarzewia mesenterica TaxID=1095465 RepID=A0A4S4L364_9AGAM|nr:hypothetical protein EW146_g9795 [Bondarzewia mesenterica]